MAMVSAGTKNAGLGPQQASASLVNSFRMSAVIDRLTAHIANRPSDNSRNIEFYSCCISLARGIDFAIANNEIPLKAKDLPSLLKQIFQLNCNDSLSAAVMVLMISVKNACMLGWFPLKETEELKALTNQLGNGFCKPGDLSTRLRIPGTSFSQIMERFYPFMKMGHIISSLEVKPGYATLVVDFQITKRMPHSAQDKIRLFVAHTDNIETSACIISPQQVNFVVNGKAVEKRTNIFLETGPQIPTDITKLLKYGTNLLQVIGQFSAHSIIIVAFTDVIPLPETPVLKDYVQSSTVQPNSDSDIIEGPSRISLNCPISRARIKLPIKGQLCKHLQCFDFGNYADINSRMPTWRCPHCNQPVCYTDIRVDQNTVKILKEVGDSVVDIIISDDGSWKAVMESGDKVDDLMQETESDHSGGVSNKSPPVLDLTGDDEEIGKFGNCEVEDRKPSLTDIQNQSAAACANNTPMEDDFFSGIFFPNGSNQSDIPMFSQFSAPSNITAQQTRLMDEAFEEECLRLSSIPGNVMRNPIAIQALPAQSFQTPSPQQRPATAAVRHYSQPQASAVSPAVNGFSRSGSEMERPQHFSRVQLNPPNVPDTAPSRNNLGVQNRNSSDLLYRMHPVRSPSPGQLRPPSLSTPHTQAVQGQSQRSPFYKGSEQNGREKGGGNSNGMVQPVSRTSELVDTTASDTNWRPVGRMRGSLVPGSYSPSLDHLIIRPTIQSPPQTTTTAGQPSLPVQPPPRHTTSRSHPTASQTPGHTEPSRMMPSPNPGTP